VSPVIDGERSIRCSVNEQKKTFQSHLCSPE
jgi:hypothetical protein